MWKAAEWLSDPMDFIEYVTQEQNGFLYTWNIWRVCTSDLKMFVFSLPTFTISDIMNQEDTHMYLPVIAQLTGPSRRFIPPFWDAHKRLGLLLQ